MSLLRGPEANLQWEQPGAFMPGGSLIEALRNRFARTSEALDPSTVLAKFEDVIETPTVGPLAPGPRSWQEREAAATAIRIAEVRAKLEHEHIIQTTNTDAPRLT